MNAINQWRERVLSVAFLKKIDGMAAKRFTQPGLAEEAAAYVLDYLAANNWQRCCNHSGKSSPDTYLYALVSNSLEDFARRRFSRPRPPAWLQRRGRFWVELWRRICLERQLVPSVVDVVCAKQLRQADEVKAIIADIRAKIPNCGQFNMEVGVDNELGEGIADSGSCCGGAEKAAAPDEELAVMHGREVLTLMELLLAETDSAAQANILNYSEELCLLRKRLNLTAEQQLLLRMVYQEGLSLKQSATLLGIPAYQPGRILQRALSHIRDEFERVGLSAEALQEVMDA